MTARITDFEIVGESCGRWRWTGTPPFYVFGADGNAIMSNTTATEITIDAADYDHEPTIEVLDATQTSQVPQVVQNPATIMMQWRGVPGASYYKIERWNADTSEWEPTSPLLDQYPRHDGRGYYQWTSGVLNDGETFRFRVVPVQEVDGVAHDGDPIEHEATVHRNPGSFINGKPWTFDYDSGIIIDVAP